MLIFLSLVLALLLIFGLMYLLEHHPRMVVKFFMSCCFGVGVFLLTLGIYGILEAYL